MRRRNVRTNISRQEKLEKELKSHGLKSVEVSALLPMADIMSLSKAETGPEVVDILDDSLEGEDDDVSLLETSKIQVSTPKATKEKNKILANTPKATKEKNKILANTPKT